MDSSTTILTAIPTYNSQAFLGQTLASLAAQTTRPDRVVILDNCSTDRTAEIVGGFNAIPCEFIRNPTNLGPFGNMNRCLDLAAQTHYLHILPSDDAVEPRFYQMMKALLEDCDAPALAWCLDRRIDEHNQTLSVSGRATGRTEVLSTDSFLKRKAEIGNQALGATLIKTGGQTLPCRFPTDMPIVGDMVFWAALGTHCRKIVHLRRPLAMYRWHGGNTTTTLARQVQALIVDEWRAMQANELLRGKGWGTYRRLKLKGLLAVRSQVKAKRVRQSGDPGYATQIAQTARDITGRALWLAARPLVELREILVYRLGSRRRHPKNIYG